MTAKPYIPAGRTTRYEDRCDLMDILGFFPIPTLHQASQLSTLILDAGFTRPRVARVTKAQLWSYFIETILLAFCAAQVSAIQGLGFTFGALVALAAGTALTFICALIINARIQKGTIK